jgi:hypothetical protein
MSATVNQQTEQEEDVDEPLYAVLDVRERLRMYRPETPFVYVWGADPDSLFGDTPLHISPDSSDYDVVFEAIRRRKRTQATREAARAQLPRHMNWIWDLPEPLRDGILALVDDIYYGYTARLATGLSNAYYAWVSDQLGELGEDADRHPDANVERALRTPATMAELLMRIDAVLPMMPLPAWLDEQDAAILKRVAAEA